MKKTVFSWLVAVTILFSSMVDAGENRFGLELTNIVLSQNHLYDTETLSDFSKDEWSDTILVSPSFMLSPVKKLRIYGLTVLAWQRTFHPEDDETDADLSNAFLCYLGDNATVYAGLQPFSIGRGFVFEDNTPGLSVDAPLTRKSTLGIKAAHVKGNSRLYSVDVGFEPGLFEKILVFGALYHDDDDTTADLVDAFYIWRTLWNVNVVPLTMSRGKIFYAGIAADFFAGDFFVKATGIVQHGSMTLSTEDPDLTRDIRFRSYLADVEISKNFSPSWSMSGIFFVRSGGTADSSKDSYHTFIAPRPMNYRTVVFSNDQFGPYLNESGFYSQGVVIPGLVAPALTVSWTPADNLMVKTLVSMLYPFSRPEDGASFYGWEWDMSFSYKFRRKWELFGEAGYFDHGDFFKDEQAKVPEPATRFLGGIKVEF